MSGEVQYDRDAEVAVLADCMASKRARQEARKFLVRQDFYRPEHQTLWDAMARLDRHGRNVDSATISAVVHKETTVMAILIDLITAFSDPDGVADHCAIVRGWSLRRQLAEEGARVSREALSEYINPANYAASVVTKFAGIRDSGAAGDDVTALTLGELLADPDDEPDWLIPGLLERQDRLIVTGEEGLGKSHLLRQFALSAAGGLHPFDISRRIDPVRTVIVDCENTRGQVRRKARPIESWVKRHGDDPNEMSMIDNLGRIDITRDRDLAHIHQLLDAFQPGLVVIGPLYRLVPYAIQTDTDAAPILAALDTLRERGCALLMEAHAGHSIGKGGVRDLRPRGSSALLGWPEFGFGMRSIGAPGYADMIPWRGQREEREWPLRLKQTTDGTMRWIPHLDLHGYGEGGAA